MTTVKAYTDLEQSKKLAEILPLESADMHYDVDSYGVRTTPEVLIASVVRKKDIPCWSLAALLDVLPYEINDKEGTSRFFELYRGYREQYHIIYTGADEDIEGEYYDNFVDACVEMIEKLHELKML